jgi:hypothetical protein
MFKWLFLIVVGLVLSGCVQGDVQFRYADEQIAYPAPPSGIKSLYIASVLDLRPDHQIKGHGAFVDLAFPSDREWSIPVTDLYQTALSRDIQQTSIAVLADNRSEADYILEAEIFSFGCTVDRSLASFIMPVVAGGIAGIFSGDDSRSMLKYGLVYWAISMIAIPLPLEFQAQTEVRLTARDVEDNIVWQKTCIGQIDDDMWMPATARKDKDLAEKNMPLALKRCNACLLGQLRQFLN